MHWLTDPQAWIALLTLTALEIVLGIDNVIFISILAGKLPATQQDKARKLGLGLAMLTRILLLCSLTWIMRLTAPLLTVFGNASSGRDLILLVGGLFLLAKSTHEIHQKLEGDQGHASASPSFVSERAYPDHVARYCVSLDSVITAVGMSNQLGS
jgi:predicted tellurium resistance membrane protein TerC